MVSFLVRKASTWVWRFWAVAISFSSWSATCSCWVWSSASCGAEGRPPGQGLAGQVLAVLGQGVLGLLLQLVGLGLELGGLELDPLLGRGDVGHAAPDLLEVLQQLLVGEVEGLPGVLRLVQELVGLGLENPGHALHDTHWRRSFLTLSLQCTRRPSR